ncbi:MAG: FIST N-terminal domain-containing protein [Planctomycetota bacterium]
MGLIKTSQQQLSRPGQTLQPVISEGAQSHLVFVFGSSSRMQDPTLPEQLEQNFPNATLVGCTTAGEITAKGVEDETLTITSLEFQKTAIRTHRVEVTSMENSYDVGVNLAKSLAEDDLAYLLVLSDGLAVNGSSLVKGIRDTLPKGTPFSGGLAGDADRFQKTLTLDNDGIHEKSVVGVGFYGSHFSVERGSVGGWAPFGPFKIVTRSTANVVYEIDNSRALDVYSAYLGEEAKDLPASGLLYPLAMSPENADSGLIRTLLAIDREQGSLTFAGDVPEGTKVQLMHANFDELIMGAEKASIECLTEKEDADDFALLISCVGRKLLLGTNIDLEVDAVSGCFGRKVTCTGFYSYGEIGPYKGSGECELHNQTMTITTFCEHAEAIQKLPGELQKV